ncbi:ATP-binding response regulator [Allohahella marinimesophila]|uniref:histidine kinase n=1 Tax=Allohahella marinimesophila TaxID=1054972 RepID=A0ABP7NSY9_9GAMM
MTLRIMTIHIQRQLDVVSARQRARQIATLCGFGLQDQVRIATSVSELARTVYNQAGKGKVHFSIEGSTPPQVLTVEIQNSGQSIDDVDTYLAGDDISTEEKEAGVLAAKRLMDRFEVNSDPEKGTVIMLQKLFYQDAPVVTAAMVNAFCTEISATPAAEDTMAEVVQQNQELLSTLAELKARQEELLQLTRELEDTNRGVVALYAELDEKADHLRRADEMKSRFLSNMSHEFRTPLSSIRALAKLLLDHVDGELGEEQEKQVSLILQSALGLTELVNDLLDIAKIEAGKVDINPAEFDISDLFSALRGMLRPLLVGDAVNLNFIEPEEPIRMFTDEAKLSQILRNFISNALKFTEVGDINVRAQQLDDGDVSFSVQDSGVGIANEHLSLIFEEFGQIEHRLQRHLKGTGLGLPLCQNLAVLLGGKVSVDSKLGQGSTFSVTLPQMFSDRRGRRSDTTLEALTQDGRQPVLLVEDNPTVRLIYDKFLVDTDYRLVVARSVQEARDLWSDVDPVAVILDIMLHGETAWHWLVELKNDPRCSQVPVIVATEVDDYGKGMALGAGDYYVKPLSKQQLLSALRTLVHTQPPVSGISSADTH